MDKKYTYNEVYESSLKYFNGDELAATTWIKKYCLKNNDETFSELNPDDMHRRMAREFAKIEHNYDHNTDNQLKLKLSEYGYNRGVLDEDYIYNLFKDFKYVIPGGSVMSGLGSPLPVSLSNCWVIDGPNDSIDDIFRVCNEQSQLMKRRGGVGFDISKLRPYGSIVNNSAKTSTGAVSFMDLFSHVTNTIAQCIEENQRVLTDKGLVKIKNVKIGDYVWTKVGFVKVINNFNNGNKRTFKITTKFGNEIITTEDHIFLTCTQSEIVEKKIKDFNVGEPICILNGTTCDKEYVKLNHNFVKPLRNVSNQYGTYGETVHNQYEDITIPDLLTEKLAYLIGYATGDGYTDKEKNLSVSVDSKDTEIINKLINYVKDVFGIDVYARQKPSENCVIIRICGIEGCSFLLENGLHKPKTEFLRIPKNIFESSSSVQLAYLSGLFDADGYASGSKKGYSFVTVNECLADDIRIMLLSNGILGKKRCEIPNNEKWKPKYSINVVGAYNQQSFVNLMTESIKVTNKNFISKRDNYLSPFTIKNYDISKENFIPNDKYISINALSKSKSYKDGILTQDYINSVEYYGESNVYDLELEKEHLFWCEGFYVHNCGRRGALMLSIDIKHPDAKEFIEKKQDLTKVTGANISVQIDDDFMKCAISENANLYIQKFPIDTTDEELFGNSSFDELWNIYEPNVLYNGKKENTYFKIVNAKDLWNDIIHCAWSTAEPGIIFQSNHHDYSPDGVYPSFRGSCTNPCGEIYMHEDSCRLIHVNLTSFVDNPFTDEACINDERLYEITYEAMHLGDDLVDLEANAIKKILNKIEKDGDINNSEYKLYKRLLSHTLEGRRCGLGFTGLADMIAMMGLKYDSDASLSIINHVMRLMFIAEMDAQIDMAITRGHFDGQDFKLEQDGNTWYKFLEDNFNNIYQKMMKYGRRNISFNTVAPTGTVSLMAKCSSGIEPIFLPFYTRRRKCMSEGDRVDFVDQVGEKYTEFVVVHPTFGKWVESRFNELSEETLNEWKSEDWTAAYKISPWYESTANDINWEKRVELQGIVQKYITHSISSTVNLPNNVTEKEVSNIYIKSWKNQLKGITCYRDGCRSGVLVSTKTETKTEENNNNKVCINNQPVSKRPKEIPCKIFRFSNKGEKWVGVVGLVDDRPYEIFTGILEKLNIPNWVEDGFIVRNKEKRIIDGEEKLMSRYDICYIDKDGYKTCVEGLSRTFNSEYWNYAKLISGLLRHRMPLPYLIKIISSLNLDASNINTWKNGVIRTLRKFNDYNIEEGHYDVCPECGGRLLNENGCYRCLDCGYSKCG